jgi:hypothetical protein
LLGWEEVGDTWQKRFTLEEGTELTVVVGQEEGFVDGLGFRVREPGAASEDDRSGTRLDDWIDSLPPEALIDIIAKRDQHLLKGSKGSE